MNYNRDNKGQFAYKSWSKEKKQAFWALMVCIILPFLHMGVTAFLDSIIGKELTYIASPRAEAAEIAPDKIEEMKGDVLDRLSKCESGGKDSKNGIDTIDTNNKVSYGIFQFQKSTVQHYYKKMTGNEISGKDAILLALDDEKSRQLAKWIIFETDNGSGKDWFNCTKWNDLDTLVKFIKSHQ